MFFFRALGRIIAVTPFKCPGGGGGERAGFTFKEAKRARWPLGGEGRVYATIIPSVRQSRSYKSPPFRPRWRDCDAIRFYGEAWMDGPRGPPFRIEVSWKRDGTRCERGWDSCLPRDDRHKQKMRWKEEGDRRSGAADKKRPCCCDNRWEGYYCSNFALNLGAVKSRRPMSSKLILVRVGLKSGN